MTDFPRAWPLFGEGSPHAKLGRFYHISPRDPDNFALYRRVGWSSNNWMIQITDRFNPYSDVYHGDVSWIVSLHGPKGSIQLDYSNRHQWQCPHFVWGIHRKKLMCGHIRLGWYGPKA